MKDIPSNTVHTGARFKTSRELLEVALGWERRAKENISAEDSHYCQSSAERFFAEAVEAEAEEQDEAARLAVEKDA